MIAQAKYLNLGCGEHYHHDWINIDLAVTGPGVMAHDLSSGIPIPDASCDVVYHSHVLEHIRRPEVITFMKECHRVLKPGGILRVAVPDLERICRLYLEKLEGSIAGDTASTHDYKWMMLELYDQAVREQWRSDMWIYLNSGPIPNEAFVRQRIGDFHHLPAIPATPAGIGKGVVHAGRASIKWFIERLLWLKPVRAWAIGRFRLSGEIHQWMYDRYSLSELFKAAGFENPIQQTATRSLVQNWSRFDLDTLSDGNVRKPDSLFMEGNKPGQL